MGFSIVYLIASPEVRSQIQPLISNGAGKKCPIVCIPAHVVGSMTHKSLLVASAVVAKYEKRAPDPILDCIDTHIEVLCVDYEKLSGDRMGESIELIRAQVQVARDIQKKRLSNSDIVRNADTRVGGIRKFGT